MRSVRLTLLLTSLVFLGACATYMVPKGNRNLDNQALVADATKTGTTEERVRQLLGEPTGIKSEDGEDVWEYTRRKVTNSFTGEHDTTKIDIYFDKDQKIVKVDKSVRNNVGLTLHH